MENRKKNIHITKQITNSIMWGILDMEMARFSVSYATQGTNTVGRIEAFNADTLEPVWISEIASHNERSTEGPILVVNDAVASKLFMTMDIYILERCRNTWIKLWMGQNRKILCP